MKEVSPGLQMVLVVNLSEHGAFINDLSAKARVVKPAVTVELGGTEWNEQQRRSSLALEIFKLNNMAKNNLFSEIGKLEKAWRNFGGRFYEGWILGDGSKTAGWWARLYMQMLCAEENVNCKSFSAELIWSHPEVHVPFLAPAYRDVVTSGRNSEDRTGKVLELERLIYVVMLTASYVHSLAKHRSRHRMKNRRKIRQEPAVIWKPEVLVRKKGYFRWWERQWRKQWCGKKKEKCDEDIY